MTDLRRAACTIAALLILVWPAAAIAEARDRLFEPGTLAELSPGAVLTFARSREVPENGKVEPILAGALTIRIAAPEGSEPATALVRFDEPEREIVLPPTPTTAAHPALLVFLESSVNSLAQLSGGSPHYIRNRFIEAFANPVSVEPVAIRFDGGTVEGERMLFRPFEGDANADRLGELAALELAFVLSAEVPGRLLSASANGGGYSHTVLLQRAEEKP